MTDVTANPTATPPAPPNPAPNPAADPGPAATPPWFEGKADAEVIGHMQNNGWTKDPVEAAIAASKAHREAQKLIGVPANELLRMPKPNAPTTEIEAFWQRLGAEKDPAKIDLSEVKSAAGEPIDGKLADAIRAAAVSARAPKEIVRSLASAVQRHLDAESAARAATSETTIQEQKEALDKSWGRNREANLFVARNALSKLATAAGMAEEKAQAAWDALSKVGGVDASIAMEMLRVIGVKMGEDRYVAAGGQSGSGIMSREQAAAEIGMLKQDKAFAKRLFDGDVESKQRWAQLHKIAHGPQAA